MENLDLNLNVKSSDDVLREAAEYFADQGYSVLNQGFAEIVTSPRLLKEYTNALTEGCNANDAAVIASLMDNSAQSILNESLGGIMPLSSLSMPVIRKLWPRVSMKEGIKTIVAKAPIFSIVYTKPYLFKINADGTEVRKDLPRGAFAAGGYDADLNALAKKIELKYTAEGSTFAAEGYTVTTEGGFTRIPLGFELDADLEVAYAGASKKLGLEKEIVLATASGTILVKVAQYEANAKGSVLYVACIGCPAADYTVTINARKTSEWNDESWDVNFDMVRQDIRIGTGEHLNAPLSVEQVQDAKALYNMDAAAEITDLMTNVFAQKLDHEIIDFLVKCFIGRPTNPEWAGVAGTYNKHLYSFNVAPAAGYAGSPKAWREELKPVIDYAATALMQETYFQSGSFVICGNPHDTALLTNVDWQYKGGTSGNVDGVAINYSVGVFQSGSYVYKVISSMNLKAGSLMLSFIPSGEKQLTTAYYPYSFVMEKGTGYRSPNHALVPSIMMTKRHTFFEFTPAIAMIAIEGNTGMGQFNRGNLYTNKFEGTDPAAAGNTWGEGVK